MKPTLPISPERWCAAAFVTVAAGTFIAVGASIFTSAPVLQLAALLALPAFATAALARRLPTDFDGALRTRRLLPKLLVALAVLAAARLAGLALFMAHPEAPQGSPMAFDEFYVDHSCFSAWWKAGQLSAAGAGNIYDENLYLPQKEGRFVLDEFIYPPPFLLLSQAWRAAGATFLQTRAGWYAVEGLLFLGALLGLCAWIDGSAGKRAALWSPAILMSQPILLTLQTGNFQIAALALSVLAMVCFERKQMAAGGALLGFAMFKIFPGVLCAYLLFARRWRALAWVGAFFLGYTALAWFTLGSLPFKAFFGQMWPAISSGELWWSWLDSPKPGYVTAINDSVPAILLKLRDMGAPWFAHEMLSVASTAWSLVVVAGAWVAARRMPDQSRSMQGLCWIALLGLSALRSPFVPDQYALIPAVWVWCMVATRGAPSASCWRPFGVVALWVVFATVMPFQSLRSHVTAGTVGALTVVGQVAMVVLLSWVVFRRHQASAALVQPRSLERQV